MTPTPTTDRAHTRLAAGTLSLPELVFTALATLAPLTLVAAVAPLHFLVGGSAVPGGYLIAAGVMALFAVGLTTMMKYVKSPGAFYVIISRGLGKHVGTMSAMVAVLAYNALQISTYGAIGLYATESVSRWTGVELPWWLYGLVALVLVGALGYRGITASAKVLGAVLILEILVLVLLCVAVIAAPSTGGLPLETLAPSTIFRPESGAMFALIFGAFMGFESTAIYSEEVKGGSATVRKATYIVVAFIGLFYGFMSLVIVAAYGTGGIAAAAEADPAGLVTELFARFTNPVVYEIMNVLLILSAFAALLALHNASNRYVYALGRERIFPAVFARIQPRTGSPWVAGLSQSVLAFLVVSLCAALAVDPYTGLLLWGSALGFLAIIVLWALCSLAISRFLRANHPEEGAWKTTVAPLVACAALSVVSVLVVINFDLFSGGTPAVNAIVFSLAGIAALAGLLRAAYLRAKRPEVFAALAEQPAPEPTPTPTRQGA